MNELLEWAGALALCMLAAAVLVAGWEQLAREAAAVDRGIAPGSAPGGPVPAAGVQPSSQAGTHNAAQAPAQAGVLAAVCVDVLLDTPPGAPGEGSASHAAMAAVLTRAAARSARDGSPWLDTRPQVTMGCAAAAPAVDSPERSAQPAAAFGDTAAQAPQAMALQPAPAPAPDRASTLAGDSAGADRPSTIERAALR